jgi:nicotinate-nucleotide adenylyltransferase
MLHFWKASAAPGRRLGILPAAFNPPTLAHLTMAGQALQQYRLDEVLFLLPMELPHKAFSEATFEQRLEMLRAAVAEEPRLSIGSTDRGLFLEIARECRPVYGPEAEFFFLCGRDAAERVIHWDYGPDPPFAEQLSQFQLLVAPRGGPFEPPAEFASRIHPLEMPASLSACSSSAARHAIAAGRPWEQFVPPAVAAIIRRDRLYGVG